MTPRDIVVTHTGARFLGHTFPCSHGRTGITRNKREGDGATPAGTHRITGLLYRSDRIRKPADWALPIGPGDLWSDDPKDPDYNMMVTAPHAFGHERLYRADPLYDVIILTDWNWPYPAKNHGSAIFLHTWRNPGHPTEGCVAFSRSNLLWIVERISFHTRLIIRA